MNKRWDVLETSAQLRHITKTGVESHIQDCVAGVEISNGTLAIDLRNLRPVRVLDRDNLILEIYLADVLTALADRVETLTDES